MCPRCTSKRIERVAVKVKTGIVGPAPSGVRLPERRVFSSKIMGESKDSWKSFHGQELVSCPECGGVEFDFDWKHKEKICKKCGNVVKIPRRTS